MDTMAKAAQVKLLGYKKAGGGRVAVLISGDIAAVRAAVEAGASQASSVGAVLAARVIANPPPNLLGAECWARAIGR